MPALEVQKMDRNSVNTKNYYDRSLASFYEEFFKCYIGDHKLASPTNTPDSLVEFAKENALARHTLLIRAIEPSR